MDFIHSGCWIAGIASKCGAGLIGASLFIADLALANELHAQAPR